jgi:hypothetical protein
MAHGFEKNRPRILRIKLINMDFKSVVNAFFRKYVYKLMLVINGGRNDNST